MKPLIALILVLVLACSCYATSGEVLVTNLSTEALSTNPTTEAIAVNKSVDFWQEADIIFWQTAPFAVFWTAFADNQFAASLGIAGATHWEFVLVTAAIISAGNAYFHAMKDVRQNEVARQGN